MYYQRIFALISAETVQNRIVCDDYETANQIARATYGEDAVAVECNQYAANIGDAYRNNTFYSAQTGEEIARIPSEAENIASLQAQNDELTLVLADMIGGGAYAI